MAPVQVIFQYSFEIILEVSGFTTELKRAMGFQYSFEIIMCFYPQPHLGSTYTICFQYSFEIIVRRLMEELEADEILEILSIFL